MIKDFKPKSSLENLTPNNVIDDDNIVQSCKVLEIIIIKGHMDLVKVEEYLCNYKDKQSTDYRKLLCAYD